MSVVVGSPVIDFVVDVVNGWADAVRHDPPGPPGLLYPSRVALEKRYQLSLASIPDPVITQAADRLYTVFAAPAGQRVKVANELIAVVRMRPMLDAGGLSWQAQPDEVIDAMLFGGLIRYALDEDSDLHRLGTCTGYRCRDAYVDHSQGRTRRYCSTRCQNRTKTRLRRSRT